MTIGSGPSGEVVNHTLPQVTTVNNTAKFPYLKFKGNHMQDQPLLTSNRKIVYRDPFSADYYLVSSEKNHKARSTLSSALPDEHHE
ncbi:hypothetical protein Tco_0365634 [Tanacetum coccineum]